MMRKPTCAELVRQLLENPTQFNNDGQLVNDLLQAFFDGEPLDTLRSLLKSSDVVVLCVAASIASELGREARGLIDDVIPLLYSGERFLQFYAMEVITMGCEGENAWKFALVIRNLENEDIVLRNLAMNLLSRVEVSMIEAARDAIPSHALSPDSHVRGLGLLLERPNIHPSAIRGMIRSGDPVIRRYGAVVAKRVSDEYPELMTDVEASDDADLRQFLRSNLWWALTAAGSLLIELGFEKRTRHFFTIELAPAVLGWLDLDTPVEHFEPGSLAVDPMVGVRFQDVERIVAECRGKEFHAYISPTVSTPLGALMPEQNHRLWRVEPGGMTQTAVDLVAAIAKYGLPYMRSLIVFPSLRKELDSRSGSNLRACYRRPVAALLAGDLARAHETLENEVAALHGRTDPEATEFTRFANAFRKRLASS